MLSPLALIVGGEGLILLGFFLPWFQGDGVLALRTFSGFGLARDLHTLSTSMETVTGASLAPLMFYAIPAGTVGVAVYTLLAGVSATSRLLTLCAGIYTLAVVMVALVIALTPVTDATRLLGAPSWGLAVTAAGAMLVLSGSRRRDKQDAGA